MTTRTAPNAGARHALAALTARLGSVYRGWQRARRMRATVRAMSALEDRVLRDIGLDRSELLSAAAELHGHAERQRHHTAMRTSAWH
jgi:uncharacterized protein YjiS (DUF1127 family)